jgi:hypothetical protein
MVVQAAQIKAFGGSFGQAKEKDIKNQTDKKRKKEQCRQSRYRFNYSVQQLL